MSKPDIKLSIIMPVYNEEKFIARALESVLYQNVNFDYEIILIDDNSTDRTVEIIKSYQKSFKNIQLIVNERNHGKGYGMMKGYETASGEYFHVLDGDDFFINFNKLQKQVDFLDKNNDYVAIAHNSIVLFDDHRISFISSNIRKRSYEYEEAITNKFYFHTSSYMYRKIQNKLPEIFLKKPLRGDSALNFFHVFHSKKKVMYHPDISSVYNHHGKGLWTGMTDKEKFLLITEVYKAYMDLIIVDKTKKEYHIWKNILNSFTTTNNYQAPKYRKLKLDQIINFCINNFTKIKKPNIFKKAFRGMYSLRIVDQLCEAVGNIIVTNKSYLHHGRTYDENKVAILVSGLSSSRGRVFKEIKDLIKIHLEDGKCIDIFSTNLINTEMELIEAHFNDPRIRYWQVDTGDPYTKQLESLIDAIYMTSPVKIYPFISHHDAILISAIQKGLGKYITIDYVFDRGLFLGIHNSSIDKYIVKTESQIDALSSTISSNKLIYIPQIKKSISIRRFFNRNNDFNIIKTKIIKEEGENFISNNNPKYFLTDLQDVDYFQLDDSIFLKIPDTPISPMVGKSHKK